ncbi:MAG: chemotaxis protein CheX [Lachnospiraceae bacterium]|nr:chemotaxis protein CheX [Lachnospiraceae bacterium]
MFGIYFGKYLQDKGVITSEQYKEMLEEIKSARLRMGLLAIVNGMMTEAQAEEVNQLQQVQDRRFGDIAVDKGYLTDEQVGSLLKMQGDQYLLFVQALTDHGYLSLEGIQKELKNYKKDERFSALDLDAIKSSDLDKIVPVFTKETSIPPVMKDYIALMARNILRFIDTDLRLEQTQRVNSYSAPFMASQELEGEFNFFVGFSGDKEAVLAAASTFGKEDFEQIDEDSLDAICEFINCNNGLYASKLSEDDIELELMPPMMYVKDTKIQTDGPMYTIPMYISGKKLELVICLEARWSIN